MYMYVPATCIAHTHTHIYAHAHKYTGTPINARIHTQARTHIWFNISYIIYPISFGVYRDSVDIGITVLHFKRSLTVCVLRLLYLTLF